MSRYPTVSRYLQWFHGIILWAPCYVAPRMCIDSSCFGTSITVLVARTFNDQDSTIISATKGCHLNFLGRGSCFHECCDCRIHHGCNSRSLGASPDSVAQLLHALTQLSELPHCISQYQLPTQHATTYHNNSQHGKDLQEPPDKDSVIHQNFR